MRLHGIVDWNSLELEQIAVIRTDMVHLFITNDRNSNKRYIAAIAPKTTNWKWASLPM